MIRQSQQQLMEMFVYETNQLLEQLEEVIIESEEQASFSDDDINELFRIMHTIKGSAAMMRVANISKLAHFMEELFAFIREKKPLTVDYSTLTDLILKSADFIKIELGQLETGEGAKANEGPLLEELQGFLIDLKHANKITEKNILKAEENSIHGNAVGKYFYEAVLYFEDDCPMPSARAFMVLNKLKETVGELSYSPANLEAKESEEIILRDGFRLHFSAACEAETIRKLLQETLYLKKLELTELGAKNNSTEEEAPAFQPDKHAERNGLAFKQSVISVNIAKLDQLMDLVGELVIAESMVTRNPDLAGLELDNFNKATSQLRKIIGELQDTVMSIRMVPLSATFQKLKRIVRDMGKKLDKSVQLQISGEETEVDKNIIEHLSDPLIHIIRNSIDHGIETSAERLKKGKPPSGKVTLEAKNAGGDVLVLIKDDGRGLDRERILKKAKEKGLLKKPESELSDQEIYSLIFLPGFSTREKASEFSGRGVGMDVVKNKIENIGGEVSVDSKPDQGTTVTIKIPLTLAIIGGMNIKVGSSQFTLPITAIREAFRPKREEAIVDPEGNEMLMIRGQCYPVLRLHRYYNIQTEIVELSEGIIIVIENDGKAICLFADELLGEQQVVVKALPKYIKKVQGLSGCTLLGDGKVSLILDPPALIASDPGYKMKERSE